MTINKTITLNYFADEVLPYINWTYFYFAWGIKKTEESNAKRIKEEAIEHLKIFKENFPIKVRFVITEAGSINDDIYLPLFDVHLPFLRQQYVKKNEKNSCLADFIRPFEQKEKDYIGIFAATIDKRVEEINLNDQYKHLLTITLSDRLVEAAIEKTHQKIRKHYWGYSPKENLTIEQLHLEEFCGIRPAIGYPSIPDLSMNNLLDQLIDFSSLGIELTEHGAMRPHASISGLMFSHPKAHYFAIGPIDEQQLEDYAKRRNISIETLRPFLLKNIY